MGGVEECGGRSNLCGWRVKLCGGRGECRRGGVWEEVRCVGEVEERGGRGKVCGRGGGVWWEG